MLSGHFIPSTQGRVFLTVFGSLPAEEVVLCLPPLFEEMNLSRAVVARQAQFFARQGLTTCVLDYFGTGDSEGEIDQASCVIWLDDVLAAGDWLQAQGAGSLTLWGIRFGGLMLLHYQRAIHQALPVSRQLLWKPLLSGRLLASQFLRLKHLGGMLKAQEKTDWRQKLRDGETIEVAGYPVNETLIQSMEALVVDDQQAPRSPLAWMELAAVEVSPKVAALADAWATSGGVIRAEPSPAFWQTPDVFTVPALYPRSFAMLESL